MRADFRLMQDLAKIVHTNADAKIKEIKNLMDHFKTNEKCKEKQALWHLKFNETPQELQGFKYNAGNLLMGPNASGTPASFDIEKCAREIDRKIQGKMYTQTQLKNWAIFHGDRDGQIASQFKSTMAECLSTCGYDKTEPMMCEVKPSMRADNWIKVMKAKLKEGI
jgi:hypothetical protein